MSYRLLLFILLLPFLASTQNYLDNTSTTITLSQIGEGHRDLVIPGTPNETIGMITLTVRGADGGAAYHVSDDGDTNCRKGGGNGARAFGGFSVGTGSEELKPGGTLRFIVGVRGIGTDDRSSITGGGGGGGSGVLYTEHPDPYSLTELSEDFAEVTTKWVLLAVAGGGGGGAAEDSYYFCEGTTGKEANNTSSGSSGRGTDGGNGGSNGSGGGSVAGGNNWKSNGGGGLFGDGSGNSGFRGPAGGLTGEVASYWHNEYGTPFGFGLGAGGQHATSNEAPGGSHGSGGGGYSGGGGGDSDDGDWNGGGGGGSFIHSAALSGTLLKLGSDNTTNDGSITYEFTSSEYSEFWTCTPSLSYTIDYDETVVLDPLDIAVGNVGLLPTSLSETTFGVDDYGVHEVTLTYDHGSYTTSCTSQIVIQQTMDSSLPPLDFDDHYFSYTGGVQDYYLSMDYPQYSLVFSIRGAGGGRSVFDATAPLEDVISYGGQGAYVRGAFLVGCGANKIPPGSIIRIIVGGKGTSDEGPFNVAAAGGGGSAVLMRAPGALEWTLLLAAGGGGGGHSSISESNQGRGGNSGLSGTNALGNPMNDFYGESPDNGSALGDPNMGFYGAGAFAGPDPSMVVGSVAGKGFPDGGAGGAVLFVPPGGWGFGGGGSGGSRAGGGGGYSGGDVHGGGGSYIHPMANSRDSTSGLQLITPAHGYVDFFSSTSPLPYFDDPIANCNDLTVYLEAVDRPQVVTANQLLDDASKNQSFCGTDVTYAFQTSGYPFSREYDCADLGTHSEAIVVNDIFGRTTTCFTIITVVDTIKPVAIAAPVILSLDLNGNASTIAAAVDAGSSDNCGINNRWLSQTSFTIDDLGDNTVTFYVTDNAGNQGQTDFIVTVVDDLPPFLFLADIELNYCSLTDTLRLDGALFDDGSFDQVGFEFGVIDLRNPTIIDDRIEVTVTATDEYDNTAYETAYVNLTTNIELNSQAEVDEFPEKYPDCEELIYNLTIKGSDITDLSPLAQVTQINGDLTIENCLNLNYLTGLENLTTVNGEVILLNNNALVNLHGLANLSGTVEALTIQSCQYLSELFGTSQLTEITDFFLFESNVNLTNFSSLEALTSIGGDFTVQFANNLTSLTGFENLDFIGGNVVIYYNPDLASLASLSGLQSLPGNLTIQRNQSLETLSGLGNLQSVNSLTLLDNDGLTGISHLGNLATVASITIQDNALLSTLLGLAAIDPEALNALTLVDNPNLSFCEITTICTYLEGSGSRNISGNGTDCSTATVILNKCAQGDLCPEGNVLLTSQAEVDEYTLNHYGCEVIDGNLHISGSDIHDLQAFEGLREVTGNVFVGNTITNNLLGLNSLRRVGGHFQLQSNPLLINISSIDTLSYVGGELEIDNNPNLLYISGFNKLDSAYAIFITDNGGLLDISGFNNLSFIEEDFVILRESSLEDISGFNGLVNYTGYGGLNIGDNSMLAQISGFSNLIAVRRMDLILLPSLTDISGFSQLEEINTFNLQISNTGLTNLDGLVSLTRVERYIQLTSNSNLTDIDGLSNLLYTTVDRWVITNNPLLSTCSITPICQHLLDNRSHSISNNDPGCDNRTEVEMHCGCEDEVGIPTAAVTTYDNSCEANDWTYYTNTQDGIFLGIQWDPNGNGQNTAAKNSALVSNESYGAPLLADNGSGALVGMRHAWNVATQNMTLNTPVNVRVFYLQSSMNEVTDANYPEYEDHGTHWIRSTAGPFSEDLVTSGNLAGTEIIPAAATGTAYGHRYVQFDGLSSLNGGTAVRMFGSLGLLPIELQYFRGSAAGNHNELEWGTASEDNFSHFELERSVDGRTWATLATIDGHGTLQQATHYRYTDPDQNETVYYRLRNIDLDGTTSLSEIIVIERQEFAAPVLYPNPNLGDFRVQLPADDRQSYTVEIRNMQGGILEKTTAASHFYRPRIKLSPGVYLLSISAAERKWNYRVIVQ